MYKNIYDFLQACESNELIKNISFGIINKEGVLYEFVKKPYTLKHPRIMFSITKSFTSIAIGILYDEGKLSLDDKVLSYFPEINIENPSDNLKRMTIKDLLTMSSGLSSEDFRNALYDKDFVDAFFKRDFDKQPGTHYLYSTRTSHILSAIVKKITGRLTSDFLTEKLFIPLGITNFSWEITPENNSYGGSGISINHEALSKLGILLLNDGMYNGKQIVSKKYLDQATRAQVTKQDSIGTKAAESRGHAYGYQFHIVNDNEFTADGAFGQVVYIFRNLGIGIILTSQTTDFVMIYALIQKYFRNIDLKTDFDKSILDNYTDKLSFVKNDNEINFNHNLSFDLKDNSFNAQTIAINDKIITIKYQDGSMDSIHLNERYHKVKFIKTFKYESQRIFTNVLESSNNKLVLEVLHLESPFLTQITFEVNQNECVFKFDPVITFYLKPHIEIIKK